MGKMKRENSDLNLTLDMDGQTYQVRKEDNPHLNPSLWRTERNRRVKEAKMSKFERILEKISHNRGQRNSPNWAFMEMFKVPNYDKPDEDYLWRLRIIQTPWFGVYLHKLCGPDPRDTLHNHPWTFVSFILKGGYTEFVPGPYYAQSHYVKRVNVKKFGSKKNPLSSFHWIAELDRTPTWTLVFVGRRKRVWGYLDRDGTYTDYDKHEFNDSYTQAMEKRGGGDVM